MRAALVDRWRHWVAALPLMLLPPLAGAADVYVFVNAANTTRVSQKDVLDLYMGRLRNYSNGDFALAFDLPRDDATRAVFYRTLTGLDPAQVNAYWARLMFTGQTMPPQALPGEAAMLEVIRRNPGAIGYLGRDPGDKGLHLVVVLKDAPSPSANTPGASR